MESFLKMTDLFALEFLQIVGKVTNEIENYTGMKDKTLAEFILHVARKQKTLHDFKLKLDEIDAKFPLSLIESVYRWSQLLPKKKKKEKEPQKDSFSGLVIKDDAERIRKMMEEEIKEREKIYVKPKVEEQKVEDVKRGRSRSRDRYRSRSRDRKRSKSRDRSPYRRSKRSRSRSREPLDDEPVLNKIYKGRVTGIKDFGAFVSLYGIKKKTEGMVHISCLLSTRVNHPSDVVERGDSVYVKVISIAGNRIGLSMKEADQHSGADKNPIDRHAEKPIIVQQDQNKKKRLSSPERFEIKQLIASGVLDAKDYPDFDEEQGILNYEDKEEELDIEVKEIEPNFLSGQTKQSVHLSPIKIIKNPDGSLNRAALQGQQLAKERREIRQQNQIEGEEDKKTAPDWKKKVFNQHKTFGKVTNMSITEQRESLPIFKLRDTIIKAVEDNQILVVVGETGSGKV
jgi:ATP-dependent RNA helicase DHX8/PRP22